MAIAAMFVIGIPRIVKVISLPAELKVRHDAKAEELAERGVVCRENERFCSAN
jgi:hypothetical protein